MSKVYQFIANGSEEIETLTTIDVLRRGGVEVTTVSITGSEYAELSHGVTIKCDTTIEAVDLSDADMLLLPGGLPGSDYLLEHKCVRQALLAHNSAGGKIGAICAAPKVLGDLGLLIGKRATCYPGCEAFLLGAEYTAELFTIDGNIITGKGPAATLPYAYAILEMLGKKEAAEALKEGMIYNFLMEKK